MILQIQNKETQLDEILNDMAEQVQLDDTRYDRMIQSYNAVKAWIEGDEKFFKPFKYDVYPHGSVRISTTVKPFGSDEFDLDIAIHLKTNWSLHTPQKLYDELKRRLLESGVYRDKIELKNRCIRINYAGDFHMDILPGIQENEFDQNTLKVSDRERGQWVISNPRGYADWFMQKNNLLKESLLEKALRAEQLPTDNFKNKKPLQRSVQLIKRYRDIYFQHDDTYKTSSIVLTTIAGQFYNGEDSIFKAVDGIITKIQSEITTTPSRIKIFNPVNSAEDFTDKWDTDKLYYEHFKKFCLFLHTQWQELKKQNGVINESKILKGLFGEELFNKVQANQTILLEQMRKDNKLGINRATGNLVTAGAALSTSIKNNTFFGE